MANKSDSVLIVNVRLPDELVGWLDTLVKRRLYHSRSEAIRDFVRTHLESRQ